MDFAWKFVAVVVLMTVLDYVWARYTIALTAHLQTRAGLWAAVLALLNAAIVLAYVNDPWLIAAAVIGAFIGTYYGAKK